MADMVFTSKITVEEIRYMGDDILLYAAAKVIDKDLLTDLYGESPPDVDGKPLSEAVPGLLRYMMRHRHGTPFEHGTLTVRVHAPIKVFREWHRHRIGWSYNEESGRYKQLAPVFYIPPRERLMIRPEGFKSARPAFDKATDDEYESTVADLREGYTYSYALYERMLRRQVDRGLARDVLGVGLYSSMYATANPRSIMAFLELRTSEPTAKRPSFPLYEIEVAARQVEELFAKHWPITYAAWVEYGRMAP